MERILHLLQALSLGLHTETLQGQGSWQDGGLSLLWACLGPTAHAHQTSHTFETAVGFL